MSGPDVEHDAFFGADTHDDILHEGEQVGSFVDPDATERGIRS